MSICVLNCATMAPWFPRWHVGTPCLLIETNQGLVLVDTGLGLHEYTSPSPVVRLFRSALRVPNDPGLTAVRQLIRQLAIGPHVPRLRAWAAAHPDVHIMAAHMWLSFFETPRAVQTVVLADSG